MGRIGGALDYFLQFVEHGTFLLSRFFLFAFFLFAFFVVMEDAFYSIFVISELLFASTHSILRLMRNLLQPMFYLF